MTAVGEAAARSEPAPSYGRPLLCVAVAFPLVTLMIDTSVVRDVLMPFAELTARWTAVWLGWLGSTLSRSATELRHVGGFACEVDPACTAFVPVVLMALTIGTSSLPRGHKLFGSLGAAALMILLNQARLTSVVWSGIYAPQWLDLLHDWCWPALLVSCAALYWRLLHGIR